PQHLLDVDFVAWTALELAPGHVADDRGEGIGDRPQQTIGLRLPVHLEPAMDAGDHEIEAGQHVLRIIQRAVGQDVGLDALQDPEVLSEFLVESSSLAMLLFDLFDREAARIVCRLRMVRDAENLAAAWPSPWFRGSRSHPTHWCGSAGFRAGRRP